MRRWTRRIALLALAAAAALAALGAAGQAAPGDGPVLFASGLAVVEAEDHDARVARSAQDWTTGAGPAGLVGRSIQATPDNGARITASIGTTGPEVGYRVLFPSAGTFQLWVRSFGLFNGNTLHAGRDGQVTAQNIASARTGVPGLTGFSSPVDLIEDRATGNLYVAEYLAQRITLVRPAGGRAPGAASAAAPAGRGGLEDALQPAGLGERVERPPVRAGLAQGAAHPLLAALPGLDPALVRADQVEHAGDQLRARRGSVGGLRHRPAVQREDRRALGGDVGELPAAGAGHPDADAGDADLQAAPVALQHAGLHGGAESEGAHAAALVRRGPDLVGGGEQRGEPRDDRLAGRVLGV